MENEDIREQPEEEQTNDESEVSVASDSGSLNDTFCELGKFKSEKDLLEAYNNLQREFTKKCQRLSKLEKEKNEENNLSDQEIDQGLSNFLMKHSDLKEFSDELSEKVKSENKIDPFENAWAKIILDRFEHKSFSKDDPLIKKYVFDDEQLKKQIIEQYVKDLNSNRPPILMSSERGEQNAKPTFAPPTSLKEAKKMVEDMFS